MQRILGTSLGLLLSAILLMIPFTPLQTIGIISILYALLKDSLTETMRLPLFITPMSLLLSNLARQQVISNL